MNKTLLFVSALALCGSSMLAQIPAFVKAPETVRIADVQARADEQARTMEFRYYESGEIDGLTANNLTSGEVWEAICMPKDVAALYAGSKVVSLNITTPLNKKTSSNANYVKNVTIFLSKGRTETPFYTQTADLGPYAGNLVNVKLDTPYDIAEGEDLWFGYYFTLTRNIANNQYYIPIDGIANSDSNAGWAKTGGSWQQVNDYGALLIGAVIEGDNLPQDKGVIAELTGADWAKQNQEYTFTATVKNTAANDMNSAEIEYTFNNGTAMTATRTFETPVASNAKGEVKASFVCNASGQNLPLSVKLTKVNGVAVEGTAMSKELLCFGPGASFKQNLLIEEGTGTWCPNCPLGIIMLESVKKTYTDGSVILVGIHSGDEMQTNTYNSVLAWGIPAFPQYLANRSISMGFYQSATYNLANFEAIYNEVTSAPAKGKIDLSLEWTSDARTSVHASAQSIFAFDFTGSYRVAFIVVEDGVGPYDQKNNLTGISGFGPFSTGGASVSWTYDDVARGIYDGFGLSASTITDPEADTYYNFEYDVPMTGVKNIENARVIAALLDTNTREVVNAVEVPLKGVAGVGEIAEDAAQVSVRAEMGAVVVNGAAETQVYTVDGRRVATAYGEATISLPAGLYIVKADKLVQKVVVK